MFAELIKLGSANHRGSVTSFNDCEGITVPSGLVPKFYQHVCDTNRKLAETARNNNPINNSEAILPEAEAEAEENEVRIDSDILQGLITVTLKSITNPFQHIQQFHFYDEPSPDRETIPNPKAKIQGQTKDGKLTGFCIIHYNDGSVFKGHYDHGKRVQGRFLFSDNSYYEGEFQNDLFHGEGKFIFPNGKVIDGNWVNGDVHGKAKVIYMNGDAYYGPLLNLKKHGQGALKLNSGYKYIGEFSEGYIKGRGAYYDPNQKLIKYGYWDKGIFLKEISSRKL